MRCLGVGPVRYMTISVHGADHFGMTTSVHIGVQLWYTERTSYVPFRYIHFGIFSNTGVNNDLHGRYLNNIVLSPHNRLAQCTK